MFSGDGEYVEWHRPVVVCDGPAEIWFDLVGKHDCRTGVFRKARNS